MTPSLPGRSPWLVGAGVLAPRTSGAQLVVQSPAQTMVPFVSAMKKYRVRFLPSTRTWPRLGKGVVCTVNVTGGGAGAAWFEPWVVVVPLQATTRNGASAPTTRRFTGTPPER